MTTDIDRMVSELWVIAKGQGIDKAEDHLHDLMSNECITRMEWCVIGCAFADWHLPVNENRV